MRNQGHVTVFLSIILISMLLLGLSVLEMARIRMGSAKAAMAAEGAACDVKAAYDKELFEEYHLLAVDSTFGGHGADGAGLSGIYSGKWSGRQYER